jgi:hypothetical protein
LPLTGSLPTGARAGQPDSGRQRCGVRTVEVDQRADVQDELDRRPGEVQVRAVEHP